MSEIQKPPVAPPNAPNEVVEQLRNINASIGSAIGTGNIILGSVILLLSERSNEFGPHYPSIIAFGLIVFGMIQKAFSYSPLKR